MMRSRARLRWASLFAILALATQFAIAAVARADVPATGRYQVDWRVQIPMRDGVELNATIYRPSGADARPQPVLVSITPYISDRYHADAKWFAQRGYVYAAVDVRGRGNSEGEFEPFVMRESEDAYDVIEWLARQPWSNGKIGMRGGSYSGHNQWLTSRLRPPHLTTVVPVASPTIGYDFPFRNNRAMMFASQWLMFVDGATLNTNLAYDTAHWERMLTELYRDNQPYAGLAAKTGVPAARFNEWMQNPAWGPYWEARNPTSEDLAKFDMPVLSITGYFDGDQLGALKMYREHMKVASASARENHYLVIGPWSHAGTRTPTKELGGYAFGDASVLDMKALDLAWYDWTMKNGPRPAFLKDRVAYFVEGDNEWRYAPSLEAVHDREIKLHLSSRGAAAGAYEGGKLVAHVPTTVGSDVYVNDPNKLAAVGAPTSLFNERGLVDSRQVLEINRDGVVYTSEPFERSMLLSGAPRLEAWIEMDTPDADFYVALHELREDGTRVFLTWDSLRARYRESRSEATPVQAGKITKYSFETFDFFARRIAKGSRLQLSVSGPRTLDFGINFNGGGAVEQQTLKDARVATVRVHHGKRYPSSLSLPVVEDVPATAVDERQR